VTRFAQHVQLKFDQRTAASLAMFVAILKPHTPTMLEAAGWTDAEREEYAEREAAGLASLVAELRSGERENHKVYNLPRFGLDAMRRSMLEQIRDNSAARGVLAQANKRGRPSLTGAELAQSVADALQDLRAGGDEMGNLPDARNLRRKQMRLNEELAADASRAHRAKEIREGRIPPTTSLLTGETSAFRASEIDRLFAFFESFSL
jgi:hypothetical protein